MKELVAAMEIDYICTGCLSNKSLKEFVFKHHEKRLHECPICHKKNHYAVNIDTFAEYILSCIDHNYSGIEEQDGIDYDQESDSFYYSDTNDEVEFTDICSILNENNVFDTSVIDYEMLSEIYEAVISNYAPERDIYSYLSESGWSHAESGDLFFSWKSFNYLVQNNNRFFEFGNHSRQQYLEKVLSFFAENFNDEIPEGTVLYRVRKDETINEGMLNDYNTAQKEIAPPPCKFSQSYRMSPKGISYTYVSTDVKTCLKECGVRVNNKILVGKFITQKPLRILDLKSKTLPYHDLFSGKFDREEQNIWGFIEDYTTKISQPVKKNMDFDYLATQVVAEYIRQCGYDGIAYSSSKTNKTNYVFFYGPDYFTYPDIRPKGWNSYIDSVAPFTHAFKLEECTFGTITNSRKGTYDIIKSII